MIATKWDQLGIDYRKALSKLEDDYNIAKKKLNEDLVISRNKVKAIEKFQRNQSDQKKTFTDFVEAMKQRLRIIIVSDSLHIMVLNDPDVEFVKPKWGSEMKGFSLTENEMRWWEHTPAAYQANYVFSYRDGRLHVRLDGDLGLVNWYVSDDTDILKYGYLRLYKIAYPSIEDTDKDLGKD